MKAVVPFLLRNIKLHNPLLLNLVIASSTVKGNDTAVMFTVMFNVMFTDMHTVKCTVMCTVRSGQVSYPKK